MEVQASERLGGVTYAYGRLSDGQPVTVHVCADHPHPAGRAAGDEEHLDPGPLEPLLEHGLELVGDLAALPPRERLARRIEARVDAMFADGLWREVAETPGWEEP